MDEDRDRIELGRSDGQTMKFQVAGFQRRSLAATMMLLCRFWLLILVVNTPSQSTLVAYFIKPSVRSRRRLQRRAADSDVASSSCPFSKAFPRYRIDLTSVKPVEKSNFDLPFLSEWKKSSVKSKVEQMNRGFRIQWLEGQDGVKALASLWRGAANVASIEEEGSVVLAFPDAQPRVVRQWLDIFVWMQGQNCWGGPFVRIDAEYDDSQVPLVQLIRKDDPISAASESLTDPTIIQKRTETWVKRVLVKLGICPFTKSSKMSGQGLSDVGVPVGSIAYHTSNASTSQISELMADVWKAIQDMLEAGPVGKKGVSSILFAAPAFDDNFDTWSGPIFAMLEAGVVAANAEAKIGVVCFHPNYATPDGSSWPGFGHMHSVPRLQKWLSEEDPKCPLSAEEVAAGGAWQRRTPHATINVLRADQLEAAEGRRASGRLYNENIRKLVGSDGIGSAKLQEDLERERTLGL